MRATLVSFKHSEDPAVFVKDQDDLRPNTTDFLDSSFASRTSVRFCEPTSRHTEDDAGDEGQVVRDDELLVAETEYPGRDRAEPDWVPVPSGFTESGQSRRLHERSVERKLTTGSHLRSDWQPPPVGLSHPDFQPVERPGRSRTTALDPSNPRHRESYDSDRDELRPSPPASRETFEAERHHPRERTRRAHDDNVSAMPRERTEEGHARRSALPRERLEQDVGRRSVQPRELVREGDVVLGKYRVDRVHAEGIVVVATATHLDLRNRVQLTLLSPDPRDIEGAHEHFLRCVRIVTHMQSEHLCRVTDAGTLGSGAPFLIAEIAGDTDLCDFLRDRGPLSITDAVDFSIQAAEALAEAHSMGICHANLTSSNIRLTAGMDGWPVVKLLGFGVMAHWRLDAISARTSARQLGGPRASVLPYLSPEQIRRPSELDGRTDIWALGAILHEMLTGQPPFVADTSAAMLAMIAADAPARLATLRDDVPRQLESIVLRCMEKDRRSRFASMAELVRALEPYASTESHGIVERVVRVVARGNAGPVVGHRSPHALVHVRQPIPQEKPSTEPPRETSPSRPKLSFGVATAVMIGVGLAAGAAGAIVTAHALAPTGDGSGASTRIERTSNGEVRSYSATPAATSVTSGAQSPIPSRTPLQVAAPAVAKHLAPPRKQSPSPEQSSTIAPTESSVTASTAAHQRLEPTRNAPRLKEAQLFDDIK